MAVSVPGAVELASAARAWLTDREVRSLAFGNLPLGARQRRADEPSMHRPLVFGSRGADGLSVRLGFGRRGRQRRSLHHLGSGIGGCFGERRIFGRHEVRRRLLDRRGGGDGTGTERAFYRLTQNPLGLLATGWRRLRVLVLVLRVARRAARLLHILRDHRHYHVIGDPALPRTVVVQNVTEPKPALLHQWYVLPESRTGRSTRIGMAAVSCSHSSAVSLSRPFQVG
ncbi:MAG: hypothetical protein HY657_07890 [Acidobacteria bacterium]|nr:hypothetical protein [Acidobacteriota bacterium]